MEARAVPVEDAGLRLTGPRDAQLDGASLRTGHAERKFPFAMVAARWRGPLDWPEFGAVHDEHRSLAQIILQVASMGVHHDGEGPVGPRWHARRDGDLYPCGFRGLRLGRSLRDGSLYPGRRGDNDSCCGDGATEMHCTREGSVLALGPDGNLIQASIERCTDARLRQIKRGAMAFLVGAGSRPHPIHLEFHSLEHEANAMMGQYAAT